MLYFLSFIGGALVGGLIILIRQKAESMGTVHLLKLDPDEPLSMYLELNGPVETLEGLSYASFMIKHNSRL